MTVPAVVLGDMDLVRPLGMAGIPCVAAGPTGPETAWSKYTIGSVSMPANLWQQPEAGVEALVAYAASASSKPVLYFQRDSSLAMISRYRETLSEYYRFVIAAPDVVEDCIDKARFQPRATELGLPVPPGVFAVAGMDKAPRSLRFPVVVKPASLRDRAPEVFLGVSNGAKAMEIADQAELAAVWGRDALRGVLLGVQEYIPGDESTLVSYHALVHEGRTVGEFTGRKLRTRPPESGMSTAVAITDIPEARELGRAVLERFGVEGAAKVDMKIGSDGSLHLLELNPRFNLWHHPGAVAGVNLPALAHAIATGAHVDGSSQAREGVRWVQVWGDWVASREAGLPTREWIDEVRTADARRAAHLDDPGSMLGAAGWAMSKAARATAGGLRRSRRTPRLL